MIVRAYIQKVEFLTKAGGGVAAAGLVLLVALIFAEIIARQAFSQSLYFTWELATYLLPSIILLGAADTLRTDGHIRVSIWRDRLSPQRLAQMDAAITLVGLLISAFLAYSMIGICVRSAIRGSVSPTPLAAPLFVPQIGPALGATFLTLQMSARLAREIVNLHEPASPKDGGPVG